MSTQPPDEAARSLVQRGLSWLRRPMRVAAGRGRARFRAAALQDARRRGGHDRLLDRPAIVVSHAGAGSARLRELLNAHSQLLAPVVELDAIWVSFLHEYVERAMKELHLSSEALQFLLWDRMLHRELMHNGKRTLVLMTDSSADALTWPTYLRCWPDARFVQLGEGVAASAGPEGLTVRPDDLARDPARELRRVCSYLDVRYEPAMLELNSGGSQHSGR